ncbi:MAG: hypothetical protein D4R48_02830 [Nitrosomonadales bacterium]|nr:MAG: hypothetical protein D4R48_02830 [Nitrosomonadales bacterium]
MNKAILIALAAALPLSVFAGEPELSFHAIPLEGFAGKKGELEHKVIPYRIFDTMTVVVEDPIACGQKPINASFAIEKGTLQLSYELTPSSPGANFCLLVSQFDVTNLPHKPLAVAFAGGPEPFVVAKLKQCEFYQPTSTDIYECLAPEIDPNK